MIKKAKCTQWDIMRAFNERGVLSSEELSRICGICHSDACMRIRRLLTMSYLYENKRTRPRTFALAPYGQKKLAEFALRECTVCKKPNPPHTIFIRADETNTSLFFCSKCWPGISKEVKRFIEWCLSAEKAI